MVVESKVGKTIGGFIFKHGGKRTQALISLHAVDCVPEEARTVPGAFIHCPGGKQTRRDLKGAKALAEKAKAEGVKGRKMADAAEIEEMLAM